MNIINATTVIIQPSYFARLETKKDSQKIFDALAPIIREPQTVVFQDSDTYHKFLCLIKDKCSSEYTKGLFAFRKTLGIPESLFLDQIQIHSNSKEGTAISFSKEVLTASCDFFKRMFQSGFKEDVEQKARLDLSTEALQNF